MDGGIFSGHDYGGNFPKVKAFVDSFMRKKGLDLCVTKEYNKERSWYTVKA